MSVNIALKQDPLFIILIYLTFCCFAQAQEEQSIFPDVDIDEVENKESINLIRFPGVDGFLLSGQYFPSKTESSAVLLLHDCSHNSQTYLHINTLLSDLGLHVLALDMRGFGASSSEDFSHAKIKRNAKDMASYQSALSSITSFWPSDILSAYQYLRSRMSKTSNIAVVSAGCTAIEAVNLAANMRISSFVMITPELNYLQKEQYKNLIDIPVYFVGSIYHVQTYQSIKELFDWNGNKNSTLQSFKGNYSGNYLLRSKPYLGKNIAFWLNDRLNKGD
jgi:hypothetical protein